MDEDVDLREQLFHNIVREYIIGFLLFVILYVISYAILCTFKRRADRDEFYSADSEDAVVYRISLWLCTFTLAVSVGAVLLLPISIVANEALLVFPKSYYLQWVNSSLIHGLWNSIFLCSNLSLFILMPFAYFFTESEGLPGSRRGVMSRVYETVAVLVLVAILIYGLVALLSASLDSDTASRKAFFDLSNFYLLYLYSCISLLGVLMLLICTPVGFALLFTVMGEVIIKPKFLQDIEGELQAIRMEEASIIRRLSSDGCPDKNLMLNTSNGHGPSNSAKMSDTQLIVLLTDVTKSRQNLEKRMQVSSLRRNLGYPLVMLLLLILTSISVLMVALNMIELLIGLKALPIETKEMVLGLTSLSVFGVFGAAVEIAIILYLMLTSVVGFYSLPFFRRLRPQRSDTPMTRIIGNCVVILVLSSALPVLSRTLGITNFDLLGNFNRIEWLGNFYLVLSYNLLFAIATAVCLVTKFTASVRTALVDRLFQTVLHAIHRFKANRHHSTIAGAAALAHVKDE